MNTTVLLCLSNSVNTTTLTAKVLVFVLGRGYAVGTVYFQYLNLWSSIWTWGGESPPDYGSIVSIDHGLEIYLDITTPVLKALIIDNATFIFDDTQDITLNVEYIIVINGGRFQIGRETEPFQHRAIITLHGNRNSSELPICNFFISLREIIVIV